MKIKTQSPIKTMYLNNIDIKQEPVSDGEYLEKSSKNKSKSHSTNKQDLISQLVSQEFNHLSKKKKRKSHNVSQVSGESSPKKIKVEKQSEDQRGFSRHKSDVENETTFLTNLFLKSDVQPKGLHNRHSLPKTKTSSAKKKSRNSTGAEVSLKLNKSETSSTKTKSRPSILAKDSSSDSSSDQEMHIPTPKDIKRETSKSPKTFNLGTKKVPVPVPIKRDIQSSQSEESSLDDEESKKLNKQMDRSQDSSSESNSEQEMPLPKLGDIKTEISKSSKTVNLETKRVPVPAPIKKSFQSEESSSEDDEPRTANKVATKVKHKDSSTESDSDQNMPVPKLEKVKKETSKSPKTANLGTKKVAVPAPIKRNLQSFQSEESSSEDDEPRAANKQINLRKDLSSSESDTDQKMPVPKLEKIKRETSKSIKTAVPAPIKRDSSASESEESSSDNAENKSNKTEITRKSETDNNSKEEPPMPKPKNMKTETPKSSKQMVAGKKTVSVPLPIKSISNGEEYRGANNISRMQNNRKAAETSSSSEEDVPVPKPLKAANIMGQKVPFPLPIKEEAETSYFKEEINKTPRQPQDSESSSEDEVPQPKRIKLNREPDLTPARKNQVPMPVTLKQEDDDSSSESEANPEVGEGNTSSILETSTHELFFRERSLYKAMNWMEKLKYKFPGIQKQTLDVRLPETNAKYSLLLVPKNVDPKSFINLKCHMNKKTEVNLNGKEYVFEPLPKKPEPAVINVNGPRLINLQSIISLQQSVPQLTLKELVVPKREDISLPSGIKVRHPLFGVNYKSKLNIDKDVKKNLQEAVEQKRRAEQKEKKQKLKKRKYNSRTVEESVLNIFNSINTSPDKDFDLFSVKKEEENFLNSPKKKHKHKKKNNSTLEMSQNSSIEKSHRKKKRKNSDVFEDSLEYVHKKKKKKKHE